MEKVIEVSRLVKQYKVHQKPPGFFPALKTLYQKPHGVVNAVNDISFSINKGELVGFIGPNGAGKTTTLKCLSGLLYPTSGKINVLGFSPIDRNSRYLKKISLIMGQKNQLWWDLPAIDTFKLNKEIYEIKDSDYENTLHELIRLLDVKDLLNIPVRQLSLGQRMKMELIASLLHQPEILFLDEPTIGLDVVMQKKMREFIAHYNKEYKATILLTSHYMADVAKLCNRIIIINHGKLIYDGALSHVVKQYADFKIIRATFKKAVDPKDIPLGGKILSNTPEKIVLTVSSIKAKDFAFTLLKTLPVDDLNIEDPELEEVIRNVFRKETR